MDVSPDRLLNAVRLVFRTQKEFAARLGVHESTVSRWLKGERPVPQEILQMLIDSGIKEDYLAGESDIAVGDASFELRMAQMQDAIDTWAKQNGSAAIDDPRRVSNHPTKRIERSIEVGKITKDIPTAADITIPLHWQSVPAGDLAPIVTESFDEFNITKRYANTFAVYIRGESMIGAGIEDGDIAVFKEGMAPREGQVVYACVNNMCTVKVYTLAPDGHVVLTPANEKYQPIDVKDEDVLSIRGVMVNLVREPKPYREPKSHSKK